MEFRSWFSVTFLALFVISGQNEARRLHYNVGVSDPSAQQLTPQSSAQGSMRHRPAQEQAPFQSQQTQIPRKELKWSYPSMPEEPQQPEEKFVPDVPVPADSVAVRCSEANVEVEVNRDFFGIGQLIEPAEIRLGDCFMTGDDISSGILVFNVELHECGSSLQMTADELIYTFTLEYAPEALGPTPIVRTNGATVDIQCRYARQHNVSSESISPTWKPFAADKVAEDVLVFSLRLMAANWQSALASNTFYLGDLLHIEASVIQYNHVPLRVFVHSCVATAVPNMNIGVKISPRYPFIENHGCLVDAKLTGSRSRFLPRSQDDKLRFELEAFRFAQGDSNEIYITCQLVATAASSAGNHKACSFSANGWTSADGMDKQCDCCEDTCGSGTGGEQFEATAFMGPIKVDDAY